MAVPHFLAREASRSTRFPVLLPQPSYSRREGSGGSIGVLGCTEPLPAATPFSCGGVKSSAVDTFAAALPERGWVRACSTCSSVCRLRYHRPSYRVTAALQGCQGLLLDRLPYVVILVGWAKNYHSLSIRRPVLRSTED